MYHDTQGREIEDLEGDNMRYDAILARHEHAKSLCFNCGRPLHYGWLEMCQQCDIHTNMYMRRMFRRAVNAFTQRADIKRRYRLP